MERLRRRLEKNHQRLRKLNKVPSYYLVDTRRNEVVREIDDIEQFAREVGALYEYEELNPKTRTRKK